MAILGAAWLIKALVAFFTRELTAENLLEHPRRRALHEAVQAHPGSTYRALMDATGQSDGGVRHHLKTLERAGLIVARGQGQAVHYFENHGRYDATWKPVAALRDPALRDLHAWIQAHPDARQSEILEHGRTAWGSGPATLKKRLARLEAWGLLATRTEGRAKRYRAL